LAFLPGGNQVCPLKALAPQRNSLLPCPQLSTPICGWWPRKPLRIRDSRFGCVASEGGAPFVARRAMNLHGCALPHCAPPPPATPPDLGAGNRLETIKFFSVLPINSSEQVLGFRRNHDPFPGATEKIIAGKKTDRRKQRGEEITPFGWNPLHAPLATRRARLRKKPHRARAHAAHACPGVRFPPHGKAVFRV